MNVLIETILAGVISFVLWKVLTFFLMYKELSSKLRKIPQKPSHWLHGHAKEVKDTIDFNDYGMDFMRMGDRMYCIWIGPFPALGMCHPETFQQLNKQVSKKAHALTDGYIMLKPWLGEGLLISEGKKWERNRRLLTPAFHFNILSGYVDVMNDVTDVFLDKLDEASQKSESMDIFPYACRATLDSILKCSLSYEGSMLESKENPLLLFDSFFKLTSLGREHKVAAVEVAHKFTGDLIEFRRKLLNEQPDLTKQKRRLDFLDILLTAIDEKGQGLSRQEIQDEVDTFTAASCLSKFEYLPLFIKEVMRFNSPVPLFSRKHSKPITIDEMEIPPGPRVDVNVYAIHHNPQVWKNPEEFDQDAEYRDETDIYGYIPFSAGPRNCIGQVFAMNEIKITLAEFVNRFEVLPVKGHKAILQPSITMKSLTGLPVILRRRQQKSTI